MRRPLWGEFAREFDADRAACAEYRVHTIKTRIDEEAGIVAASPRAVESIKVQAQRHNTLV
jgi:hypothetical protein